MEARQAEQTRQQVAALYQAHALGLVKLAVLMVGDQRAAEDVVQDAFLGLYRRWSALQDREKALGYVRASVLNGCRTIHRGRYRRSRIRLEDPGHAESAEAILLPQLLLDAGRAGKQDEHAEHRHQHGQAERTGGPRRSVAGHRRGRARYLRGMLLVSHPNVDPPWERPASDESAGPRSHGPSRGRDDGVESLTVTHTHALGTELDTTLYQMGTENTRQSATPVAHTRAHPGATGRCRRPDRAQPRRQSVPLHVTTSALTMRSSPLPLTRRRQRSTMKPAQGRPPSSRPLGSYGTEPGEASIRPPPRTFGDDTTAVSLFSDEFQIE